MADTNLQRKYGPRLFRLKSETNNPKKKKQRDTSGVPQRLRPHIQDTIPGENIWGEKRGTLIHSSC